MDESAPIVTTDSGLAASRESGPDSTLPLSPRRRALSRTMAWLLVPTVLAALVLFLTSLFRDSTSETFDESIYLWMGISVARYGNFTNLASPMSPPLPILLEYWLPAFQAKSLPNTADWEAEVPGLIRQARLLTSILVGVPLVWLVYAWLSRRRGWLIGALGGGLLALSPTVLAASSVATTDACFALFAIVALAALHRYQVRPSRGSYLLAGAAMGLALASKQSAAILFPVALLEIFLKLPGRKPGATWVDYCLLLLFQSVTKLSGLIALAFLVDWSLYGFGFAPRFTDAGTHTQIPIIIPMIAYLFPNGEAIMEFVRHTGPPLAIDTFVGQMDHAARGHAAFLMGQISFQGWWYFFPVAIAIKSTPAELLVLGLVVFLVCRRNSWLDPARRLWLGTMAVLLGAGIASSINIGQRYMLLLYPLAVLVVVDRLGEEAVRRRLRVIVVGVFLLAWQTVSLVGIAPHYLSYFNSLCGGPYEGHRYLVDSSLDWGQDLPLLRRELEARRYTKVALCYFGTAKPATYGIRSVDWMHFDGPEVSTCDWLAVSATYGQGVYGESGRYSAHFAKLPSIRVGYSIFLYDLKDPRVQAAWKAVRAPIYSPPVENTPGPN